MAIDNDALIAAIDDGRENSYGSDETSELGAKRAAAIEAYLGMNTNPSPEGRSQVVDRSVFETISILLPSLVRIFASSSDEVCKFLPIGPEDEAAAEQTTAVINNVVTEQNPWEQICSDWIHDACLLSNSYAMVYWDQSERITRDTYEGQSEDQVALLLQDKELTVVEQAQRVDEQATAEAQEAYQQLAMQYQQAVPVLQAQGQPIPPPPEPPQPVMLYDLVIERRETAGKVCIRVLPPEHCYVDSDTPDWTLTHAKYFEYVCEKTIADIRAMGLDCPVDVSDDTTDDLEEDFARDRFGESRDDEGKGILRRVNLRTIWVQADAEGDNIARMYYVLAVGRTILYAEPCGRIMVSSMTPQPLPHRHVGMSVAETVVDLQDIKTAIKRGGLDNLALANSGRHVISNKVNLDDLLDNRPGGVVRMLGDSLPGEGHIVPLVHPVAFEQIIGTLEYFDNERQNRTGAMRGAAGLEANALNRAAVGTTIAMQNSAAQRVEHIARMMAPAVENLFSLVWETVSKHQNKAMAMKLRGKWVNVDPQAWRTKRDCRISVGVGAGNRDSMMQQLQTMLAAQMQIGLPLGLVSREHVHATNQEIAKLAGFANPARFWPDPQQLPPAPPQPNPDQIKAQTSMQIKQMELQADAQKFQAETEVRLLEMERSHTAKMREIQANYELQAANDLRDGERERLKQERDLQLQALEAERVAQSEAMKRDLDKYKADLDAQVKLAIADKAAPPAVDIAPLQQALEQVTAELNAPAEIIRDPNTGRAIGVRKGTRTMRVVRDETGRATGVH